ncbi:hypothetical protein [Bradyrhizobium sp. WSM471]|uniref:hypothetical protein n=1 Tax=Bradyrhizobium sp. WSM471 TaxID=319017 RepID=UPI00024D21BA|nr:MULTISPECIES: hypothetical protein [Bradyrhizobium]EHR01329.1 hypothetical protein Bra471DRAFT_02036 [Bradyrhizobium sp. WSM471]UFW43389.1 hypothetical protein BcanWSM471_10015 [Bradyrhizobium canariense]
MFVPSYEPLLKSLNSSRDQAEAAQEIKIPLPLLKLLLQIALAQVDFNEDSYLAANPDVREAVERGAIESGLMHFIGYGYFEGRRGGMAVVDEKWYLKKYPDVRLGIEAGKISSAEQHFNAAGADEGRSPNSSEEDSALQWKKVLDKN